MTDTSGLRFRPGLLPLDERTVPAALVMNDEYFSVDPADGVALLPVLSDEPDGFRVTSFTAPSGPVYYANNKVAEVVPCPGVTGGDALAYDPSRLAPGTLDTFEFTSADVDGNTITRTVVVGGPMNPTAVFPVDPDLGVTGLDLGTIGSIFRGEITNWIEVGGPDEPIVVVNRLPWSAIGLAINNAFAADGSSVPGAVGAGSDSEVTNIVANTPGAIGYVLQGHLSGLPDAASSDLPIGRPTSPTVVPTVSIVSTNSPAAGTGTPAKFTISLSQALDYPVKVKYKTRDGSAVAGTDYEATEKSVTFNPGEKDKPVEVPVSLGACPDGNNRQFQVLMHVVPPDDVDPADPPPALRSRTMRSLAEL